MGGGDDRATRRTDRHMRYKSMPTKAATGLCPRTPRKKPVWYSANARPIIPAPTMELMKLALAPATELFAGVRGVRGPMPESAAVYGVAPSEVIAFERV